MSPNPDSDWLLVVENQLDFWLLLQARLKTVLPQVELVHLTNPSTALSYLQICLVEGRRLPRLVLSNVYLPQLADGLGLLTCLKQPAYRQVPVILMGPSAKDLDRQAVNHRGGTFLPMPTVDDEWGEFLRTFHHYWHISVHYRSDRHGEWD